MGKAIGSRGPVLMVCAAVCVAAASPAWANVYASGLEQTAPDTFSYILNENADTDVTIEVWKVGGGMVYSQSLGPQAKGSHTWTWDGTGYSAGDTFKVKVKAADDGYGAWTKLTTDNVWNNFYSPRGVSVNIDPSTKNFGRIYVSNSVGGTTGAGRTTGDGIFILKADVTDAVGQGDTARTGGVAWGTTNSPYRVNVGPDNNVYLCDWSDLHSGLWMGDPDFVSASELLDSTGRDSAGMNVTHGSIASFVVEGTGVNRTIYSIDEDLPSSASAQRGSIWRYDIGTNSLFTGAPSGLLYNDSAAGNLIQNYTNDMIRASDGTWWVSQDRAGGSDTLSSLMQLSADGSTVLWKSVPALGANSLADPLRRTRGIAWDPVNDWLALATYNGGQVVIFDDDTKSVVTSIVVASNATNRDVAFDAAGNLYVVDNITERLQIYSPGMGANMFATESYFTVIPEPATLLILGVPALFLRRRR